MRTTEDTLLSVRNLQISYRRSGEERLLLHDVSFELQAGESVALVGESGSGKSTIGKAICGLLPPAARMLGGEIRFAERNRLDRPLVSERDWRAVRGRQIGMLFQDARLALNPLVKIGRHFQESLVGHRMASGSQALEIAASLLAKLGFDDPRGILVKYPFELSGGMCQRVYLALAICLQPKLLIADEPTSALDASSQWEVLELLKNVQREMGLTVLLITHDLSVAKAASSRVLVLSQGKLVEEGASGSVLTRPKDRYTRQLVAAREQIHLRVADVKHDPHQGVPLLEAASLRKRYEHSVLDGVNLSIWPGEIVGVLGKSGCGKSTLARCLAGLEQADAGRLLWNGEPWRNTDRRKRSERASRLQMIFQDARASLHAGRTALQLVQEPLQYLNLGTRRAREELASQLLDEVGITGDLQRHKPPQLSTGQCQRIAIARALGPNPRVLLCDEAVSALDMVIQAQILTLLQRIQRQRELTIIMISHDVRVLRAFCHRIAVMEDGRFSEVCSADRIQDSKGKHVRLLLEHTEALNMEIAEANQ